MESNVHLNLRVKLAVEWQFWLLSSSPMTLRLPEMTAETRVWGRRWHVIDNCTCPCVGLASAEIPRWRIWSRVLEIRETPPCLTSPSTWRTCPWRIQELAIVEAVCVWARLVERAMSWMVVTEPCDTDDDDEARVDIPETPAWTGDRTRTRRRPERTCPECRGRCSTRPCPCQPDPRVPGTTRGTRVRPHCHSEPRCWCVAPGLLLEIDLRTSTWVQETEIST